MKIFRLIREILSKLNTSKKLKSQEMLVKTCYVFLMNYYDPKRSAYSSKTDYKILEKMFQIENENCQKIRETCIKDGLLDLIQSIIQNEMEYNLFQSTLNLINEYSIVTTAFMKPRLGKEIVQKLIQFHEDDISLDLEQFKTFIKNSIKIDEYSIICACVKEIGDYMITDIRSKLPLALLSEVNNALNECSAAELNNIKAFFHANSYDIIDLFSKLTSMKYSVFSSKNYISLVFVLERLVLQKEETFFHLIPREELETALKSYSGTELVTFSLSLLGLKVQDLTSFVLCENVLDVLKKDNFVSVDEQTAMCLKVNKVLVLDGIIGCSVHQLLFECILVLLHKFMDKELAESLVKDSFFCVYLSYYVDTYSKTDSTLNKRLGELVKESLSFIQNWNFFDGESELFFFTLVFKLTVNNNSPTRFELLNHLILEIKLKTEKLSISALLLVNISLISLFFNIFHFLAQNEIYQKFSSDLLCFYVFYSNLDETNLIWYNGSKFKLSLYNGSQLIGTLYAFLFDISYLIYLVTRSLDAVDYLLNRYDEIYTIDQGKFSVAALIDLNSHKDISKSLIQKKIFKWNLNDSYENIHFYSEELGFSLKNNESFCVGLALIAYNYFPKISIPQLKNKLKHVKTLISSDLFQLSKLKLNKIEESSNKAKNKASEIILLEVNKKAKLFPSLEKDQVKEMVKILEEKVKDCCMTAAKSHDKLLTIAYSLGDQKKKNQFVIELSCGKSLRKRDKKDKETYKITKKLESDMLNYLGVYFKDTFSHFEGFERKYREIYYYHYLNLKHREKSEIDKKIAVYKDFKQSKEIKFQGRKATFLKARNLFSFSFERCFLKPISDISKYDMNHLEVVHKYKEGIRNSDLSSRTKEFVKRKSSMDTTPQLDLGEFCEYITCTGVYFGRLLGKGNYIKFESEVKENYTDDPQYVFGSLDSDVVKDNSKCVYIFIADIEEIMCRWFLYRKQAVEIFMKDGKSYLFNLFDQESNMKVFEYSQSLKIKSIFDPIGEFHRRGFTEKWLNDQLSTFEYILLLNKYSGRSYHDMNQYPIFPWIVSDYSCDHISVEKVKNKPSLLRDFNYPKQGQDQKSRNKLQNRYFEEVECGEMTEEIKIYGLALKRLL